MRLKPLEKLKMAKEHVDKDIVLREIEIKYKVSHSALVYYVRLYRTYGEKPFRKNENRKSYTRELKLKAIQEIEQNGKSYRDVALEIGLLEPSIVLDWITLYRQKGESAIKDSYSRNAYLNHDERLLKKEYKKLMEDLERTKAENEFLKKLYPEVLKGRRQLKKKS